MPKQIKLKEYLGEAEIELRYRQAESGVEKSHWQIIWLLSSQKTVKEIEAATGYSPGWIRELIRRYNQNGPEGLNDQRKTIAGTAPLLTKELQSELEERLHQPPPDGGQWSGRKVADWISQKLNTKVPRQRGWVYLVRLNYSLQQPRPHHAKADPAAQADFKKNYQSN
jgi:transposase